MLDTKRLAASVLVSILLNIVILGLIGRFWPRPQLAALPPPSGDILIKMISLPPAAPHHPANTPRARRQPAPRLIQQAATPEPSASGARGPVRPMHAAPALQAAAAKSVAPEPVIPISRVPVPFAPPIPKAAPPRPLPITAPPVRLPVAAPTPAITPSHSGTILVPPPAAALTATATHVTGAAPAVSGGAPRGTQSSGGASGAASGTASAATGNGTSSGSGDSSGAGKAGGGGDGDGGPFGVGTGIGHGQGPRHIVYLLDISLSMPTRIERAKQELHDALAGLGKDESFDIIAFAGDTQPFDHSLVPVTHAAIAQANGFLNSLQLKEGTNLEKAVSDALSIEGVNVVVVVTDGVPTVGETDFKKLARRVRELNTGHARIYTVGLVGKDPDGNDDSFEATQLLRQIARESGGESKLVSLGEAMP